MCVSIESMITGQILANLAHPVQFVGYEGHRNYNLWIFFGDASYQIKKVLAK